MTRIQLKRGTRAQLDAAAADALLAVGEPYLITDEGRLAVATTASTFTAALKEGEAGAGGGAPEYIPGGAGAAGIARYSYGARAGLRTDDSAGYAVVDTLGLFAWYPGSAEPDDDETCFAGDGGCWLLEAPHWDTIDRFFYPEIAAIHARFLRGTATCAIASVAATNSASFVGTVTGAAVGDAVTVNPPAQLGSTAAFTGRLGFHAWVSAANTVTVMLTNASAAVATVNPAAQGAWQVTVIKA